MSSVLWMVVGGGAFVFLVAIVVVVVCIRRCENFMELLQT